ncbi:MAG: histidine kinase [Oscillospiraceae bacterium]|jgi:signal transduction histidine kinase|nr:histidine kinase [Oscillospiraceae bacterium]
MGGRAKALGRTNLFVICSVLAVMAFSMASAGFLFYAMGKALLTDLYGEEVVRELTQINRAAADQISLVDTLYSQMLQNPLIYDNLDPVTDAYNKKSPRERRLEIERGLMGILSNHLLWNAGVLRGVYIHDADGAPAAGSSPAAGLPAPDASDPYLQILTGDNSPDSVYFVRNIYGAGTGRRIASVTADISMREWARLFSEGTDGEWYIFLCNSSIFLSFGALPDSDEVSAAIIAAADAQRGFLELTVGGERYLTASMDISSADLMSVTAVPADVMLAGLRRSLAPFVSAYALIAALTMVFAGFTVYLAARPLHQRRLLLKNAEIAALQAQINPHFLFNVLNTIAWKAEIDGSGDVRDMALSLGKLLRANILAHDKTVITLGEELDYTRYYIHLQQRRFEGKFTADFRISVPEDTPVPRLCIQPLVENAILHGFEPMPDTGVPLRLVVSAEPEDGGVLVAVEDNGAGFADDDRGGNAAGHTHIGLENLRERLLLYCGPKSRLTVGSGEGGTRVSFRLPGK